MVELVNFNDEKYVWSKELYIALDFSPINYSKNVKQWFEKEYLFQGEYDFRTPTLNYDYFYSSAFVKNTNSAKSLGDIIAGNLYSYPSKSEIEVLGIAGRGNFSENYLIRLELAKIIALESNSKLKKQFVQWLLSLESKVENFKLVSQEMILGLLEISKFCTYIDTQLDYYKDHKDKYFEFKEDEDSWKEFDQWRNNVLQLNDFWKTRKEYDKIKQFGNLKTKVERIAMMDSLTSIRNALFDFLAVALSPYTNSNLMKARDLANFVKSIYDAIGVTKVDILPRDYGKNGMRNMFEKYHDIDFLLVQKTINQLQVHS